MIVGEIRQPLVGYGEKEKQKWKWMNRGNECSATEAGEFKQECKNKTGRILKGRYIQSEMRVNKKVAIRVKRKMWRVVS